MKKFNSIKKSRKKSKDIDEKIQYLNKECQKTGLQEVMTTSNIYQGSTKVPNQDYNDFNGLSQGGYALGLSGADGNSLGGAINGINPSTNQPGVALSPPHPVTGVRRVASTVLDGTGSNRALRPGIGTRQRGTPPRTVTDGSAVWFYDPNYNSGEGKWYNFEWLDYNGDGTAELGFWDTNFLGFFFHNTNLDQFQLSGVNIGTQIKNKIGGINFGTNGSLGEPQTIVLTQNDLGDPVFIPVDIMSPQAYQYLNGKATASAGYSDDTYNWYVKTYGAGAAGWYMNNPNSHPSNNPFLKPGDYTPFTDRASNSNTDGTEIAMPPAAVLAAMAALFITYKGAESAWKLYRKYKQQIDQKMKEMKAQQGQTASYEPEGDLLSEAVKLGHFEPEVLNVDINDIRKGVMPEFPKDPPPEMIGGYSAKSRLVRKDPELPPFIKVTRKDLAKNHLLTDKEISQYMDEINAINDYIKKNPAELIYAMTRYPKDDPRLAQLNFKMDEMKRASDEYVETHFPENERLFNKLQDKIAQNIELTDPKNFAGHAEAPKFTDDDIEMSEQRKKTMIKHFKKPVKIKKLFKR